MITWRTDLKANEESDRLGLSWPSNCNSQLKRGIRINMACHCNARWPSRFLVVAFQPQLLTRRCFSIFRCYFAYRTSHICTCKTKTECVIFFQKLYKHRKCLTKAESVGDGLGEMVFPQLALELIASPGGRWQLISITY